jgi:hypothetical protein
MHVTICITIVRRQILFMFALSQAWRAHCSTQLLMVHHLQHTHQSLINCCANEGNWNYAANKFQWIYMPESIRRMHTEWISISNSVNIVLQDTELLREQ